MDAITHLIPVPRPLPIAAAGITVRVAELTLRDLADLQAILDSLRPDPLLEIGPALAAAQGDEWRQLLAAAYDRAETGPGVYGEPSGRPYFATPEGRAALAWVALRRHQPTMTPGQAAELSCQMNEWEFSRLWRIAHGQDTARTIERILCPFPPAAATAAATSTWGELVEEIIAVHPGWTYRDVYDMTLSEVLNARRGGKPAEDGIPVPVGMDPVAALAAFRQAVYGRPDATSAELAEPSAALAVESAQPVAEGAGSDDESKPDQPDGD